MNHKFKLAIAVLCASLCLTAEAQNQSLPEGKGKAEFIHNCTACHRADMVTKVKKTPPDWQKSVTEMASRGTDGTQQDLDNVVLYLDKFYSTDKPAAAPSVPTTPSQSNPPNPPAEGTDHIKQLISQNLCLTCHRIEQQGAYLAPSLNGVSSKLTTAQIRKTITNPPPTLDPSNTLVQLTTDDGKKITGRILSQDEQQIHLIEASGATTVYEKSSLQKFDVITTNPMPSYEKRLSGDDVENLVRYLESLPPVDDSHK
jgi:putative heme-binding domain-containing protein